MSHWKTFEYEARDVTGIADTETGKTIADVIDAKHAPLIAAAPELLAAAKEAMAQWWSDCDRLGDATGQLQDDSRSAVAYRAIRDAIAKATAPA